MTRPLLLAIPLVMFAAMFGLFVGGLIWGQNDDLPSTFVGKPAPALPDTPLGSEPLLVSADFNTGEVTVVNFWASWCPPCRAEHPTLVELSAQGIRLAGVNFRDDENRALDYLSEAGDPFFAHAYDGVGRFAIEWGVSAPPETFIIGKDGNVVLRFAGPLIGSDYEQRFLPALRAALDANAP